MSHRIAIAGSELGFDCDATETVLDAALRAGIALPYSCRKGVCGNCAGRVASGEVAGLNGASIRNETCLPDQVLFCMCTPGTDLQIVPATWQKVDPQARQRFTAKVFRNQLAAPDVSLLQLRLAAGQRARFKAGQYLQLSVEDGSTRCYSMANAPHESDALTLHIRHVPGGAFSARAPLLKQGESIEVELPFGSVALDEAATRPIVFVVGGTGFAPVKSILDDMAKRRVDRPITLIWGARRADGIYLRSAIGKWQRQWPAFRFVAAVSDEADAIGDDATFFAGRVDQALAAHCPDLGGQELYACGSPGMVAAVRELAVGRLGLASEDFHADVFVDGRQRRIRGPESGSAQRAGARNVPNVTVLPWLKPRLAGTIESSPSASSFLLSPLNAAPPRSSAPTALSLEPIPMRELAAVPKVSIAIITFNYGRFLVDCLESCLAQTVRADEIVVVNDGSTDDSAEILNRYAGRHTQIHVVHQPNAGICAATNAALAACTGDVVVLLDADDMMAPRRVELVIAALRRPVDGQQVGWAHHSMVRFSETSAHLGLLPHYPGGNGPEGWLAAEALRHALSPVHAFSSGLAFRREVLQAIGPLDDDRVMYQDQQLCNAATLLSPVAWIPEPVTRYRIHGSSTSAGVMVSLDQIKATRKRAGRLGDWIRKLLEQRRPGSAPLWRPEEDQAGYLWLVFLEQWLSGAGKDLGLLRKVLGHADTRTAPRQLRAYYLGSLILPKAAFVSYSRFIFGSSRLKASFRKVLRRA